MLNHATMYSLRIDPSSNTMRKKRNILNKYRVKLFFGINPIAWAEDLSLIWMQRHANAHFVWQISLLVFATNAALECNANTIGKMHRIGERNSWWHVLSGQRLASPDKMKFSYPFHSCGSWGLFLTYVIRLIRKISSYRHISPWFSGIYNTETIFEDYFVRVSRKR